MLQILDHVQCNVLLQIHVHSLATGSKKTQKSQPVNPDLWPCYQITFITSWRSKLLSYSKMVEPNISVKLFDMR
jgi:hypothetical protein